MLLKGKVAVVTGATGGVGRQVAHLFSAQGADLVLAARHESALKALQQELPNRAEVIACDVTDMDQLDALFAFVESCYGRIDTLLTAAGKADGLTPFSQTTEVLFDEVVNLNLKGTFFTVKKALDLLSDSASVILMAAMASSRAWPNHTVYSAAKAGVKQLTKNLAAELSDRAIRVNSISPGPTDTAILDELVEKFPTLKQELVEKYIPLGRIGDPRDIAQLALFLASDHSTYLTAEDIKLDGGMGEIWR